MRASVIIPVYNEEQNIAALLRSVSADRELDDIIVVASGCTDRTVAEATAIQDQTPAIRILIQPRREGKASAINLALPVARHDQIVLISGDVLPAAGSVRALLRCLEDPMVGVVGGRPVPRNDDSTFTGFASHLLWRLHHNINELTPENPKCGEMIAFRRRDGDRWLVPAIPMDSAVDEVSIQSLIYHAGLRGQYEPSAVVHNYGPATLRDWFIQRRRINAGHIVSRNHGYKPSTMSVRAIIKAFARDPLARKKPLWVVATISMEAIARVFGRLDLLRGRNHAVWRRVGSTKRVMELDVEVTESVAPLNDAILTIDAAHVGHNGSTNGASVNGASVNGVAIGAGTEVPRGEV